MDLTCSLCVLKKTLRKSLKQQGGHFNGDVKNTCAPQGKEFLYVSKKCFELMSI